MAKPVLIITVKDDVSLYPECYDDIKIQTENEYHLILFIENNQEKSFKCEVLNVPEDKEVDIKELENRVEKMFKELNKKH